MRRRKSAFPCAVYIAISWVGNPAPFAGFAWTAKQLRKDYAQRFGHTLRQGGYRVIRVELHDLRAENKR